MYNASINKKNPPQMTTLLRPFLNGKYLPLNESVSSLTNRYRFTLIHPSNGTAHKCYDPTESSDIQHALRSSQMAQKLWADTSPSHRAAIFLRAATIVSQNVEFLRDMESMDTGRPIRETEWDVREGIECLNYYAGLIHSSSGEMYNLPGKNWAYTQREPLGVCVGIGAWNYPLQSALWKSAPALAFGNSMIFKPSEYTPSTALWLAQCYHEAGVPEGVFQVVLGGREVGEELVLSPIVAKVSFTGSQATGKRVYEAASRGMKKVTMELGGKSPLIIFQDTDINNAVSGAMMANWYSSGQVCSNGTRVFVHESILDQFVHKLLERTKKLRIGDPMKVDTDIGPMAHREQMEKVLAYIDIGCKEGATLLYGGTRPDNLTKGLEDGYFLVPAIFINCTDNMKIVREEIFGMVMTILSFSDEEEVISRANDSEYGLAAGVFTQDIQRGHRVTQKLEAGCTWINSFNIAPMQLPWGGFKNSGIGRENGTASVESWTQWKSVFVEMGDVDCPYPN